MSSPQLATATSGEDGIFVFENLPVGDYIVRELMAPAGYVLSEELHQVSIAEEAQVIELEVTNDPVLAAKDADVVYTDVWYSMGDEESADARRVEFKNFQVNDSLLSAAKPDAIVLHCLPAHRGEEITDEVLEAHSEEIFNQTENRLHAQKAVLSTLMLNH